MITAHEKICEVVAEAGIQFVFCIPGGSAMRIFDSLSGYRDRIRTILVRREQAASIMADVYGLLTGTPGVGARAGRLCRHLSDTNFALIARGFGAEGVRVDKPAEIADAVRAALRRGRPTVVDVIMEKHEGLKSITSGATVG